MFTLEYTGEIVIYDPEHAQVRPATREEREIFEQAIELQVRIQPKNRAHHFSLAFSFQYATILLNMGKWFGWGRERKGSDDLEGELEL